MPPPAVPFGLYVHVPFCAARCGYCDFNTYTPSELAEDPLAGSGIGAEDPLAGSRIGAEDPLAGSSIGAEDPLAGSSIGAEDPLAGSSIGAEDPLAGSSIGAEDPLAGSSIGTVSGASPQGWAQAVGRELDRAVAAVGPRPVETVFVGGGTPSLLGADGLARVLDAVRARFPLAPGAEVTTESNPESTSPELFAGLAAAGYTRVSLGMQSAAPHVLAVLDRRHTPGRAVAAAQEARAAGIGHVNLDLIYATPGERAEDLRASLDAVLSAGVDHVSAYALVVEQGTALARRVSRGELPAPDDDVAAERYEMVDDVLGAAGFGWYEVSNWATGAGARCRHNLGYWRDGDWWGIGPGAHSHVDGARWWNVKHPARYAALLAEGAAPEAGREELSAAERHTERVMLRLRLAEGLALGLLDGAGRAAAERAAADGLLDPVALAGGRAVLTRRGRLLADGVVHALLAGVPA